MMSNRKFSFHNIEMRPLESADAVQLNQMVKQSSPLDQNSIYCNLLQCSHFSQTSVAAIKDGELVGFVTGYIPPNKPKTLFVWQVAVAESLRGLGLAKKMLKWLVDQPCLQEINRLVTTITPGNQASWTLFESLAFEWQAIAERKLLFDSLQHFNGRHEDEYEISIAPLPNRDLKDMQDHMDTLRANFKNPLVKHWLV
jgi:L-2,4-diaminobutyric acid acetyltransferase